MALPWIWDIGTTNLDQIDSNIPNSCSIFNEALNQDLSLFHGYYPEVTLLHYLSDLLLATKDKEDCLRST